MAGAKVRGSLGGGLCVDVEDGDAGPVLDKEFCGGEADAAAAGAARNDGGLALEQHAILPMTSSWFVIAFSHARRHPTNA